MSRGESAKPTKRSPSIAIFGALASLIVAAAFVIAWSLVTVPGCLERLLHGPPPPVASPTDPVAAAFPVLAPIRVRECFEAVGPVATGPIDEHARARALLVSRGYVPVEGEAAPQSAPGVLAVAGLEGACGVALLVPDASGSLVDARVAGGPRISPCRNAVLAMGLCDGEALEVAGRGTIVVHAFVMPGLTPDLARASGMPSDALLAHAEVESYLRSRGWIPTDTAVEKRVAPGATGRTFPSIEPGPRPATGCVPWVAVGLGVGRASVDFGASGRVEEMSLERFALGMLSCAPGASGAPAATELRVDDENGDGGRIFFRAYESTTAPAVTAEVVQPTSIGALRVVPSADVRLPPPVPVPTAATPVQ